MKMKTRQVQDERLHAGTFAGRFATVLKDPILISSPEGNLLSLNDAALQFFGILSREESGVSLRSLFDIPDIVDPNGPDILSDSPSTGQILARTGSGSQPVTFHAIPFTGPGDTLLLVAILIVPQILQGEKNGCGERIVSGSSGNYSGLSDSIMEWDEVLRTFSHGDLQKVPLDPDDPLARLKRSYNEGIDSLQKMLSVKDLFG